jgi:hypothetical protein
MPPEQRERKNMLGWWLVVRVVVRCAVAVDELRMNGVLETRAQER